jgi:hypothetical protein
LAETEGAIGHYDPADEAAARLKRTSHSSIGRHRHGNGAVGRGGRPSSAQLDAIAEQ